MYARDLHMNKHVIDMMMTIRRRVKAEFNERLMLSDDSLVETLESFRQKSVSEETRSLIGDCLTEMTGEGLSELLQSQIAINQAEGQEVRKIKRVYRGQVIEG